MILLINTLQYMFTLWNIYLTIFYLICLEGGVYCGTDSDGKGHYALDCNQCGRICNDGLGRPHKGKWGCALIWNTWNQICTKRSKLRNSIP